MTLPVPYYNVINWSYLLSGATPVMYYEHPFRSQHGAPRVPLLTPVTRIRGISQKTRSLYDQKQAAAFFVELQMGTKLNIKV